MTSFLLDTNVVSELGVAEPEPKVMAFLESRPNLWLSVIVVHELIYGLQSHPEGRRKDRLVATLSQFMAQYSDRILSVGNLESRRAAVVRAKARRAGRQIHIADGLIAGTALVHNLCVATRNTVDFDGHGLEVFNPWDYSH